MLQHGSSLKTLYNKGKKPDIKVTYYMIPFISKTHPDTYIETGRRSVVARGWAGHEVMGR